MSINEVEQFGVEAEKTSAGLDYDAGFPRYQKPARQWFNKLFYEITTQLNKTIKAVNSLTARQHYAIGDLYITTKKHINAESVSQQQGYGTWQRYAAGQALVGVSSNSLHPEWTKESGNTFGEYDETLEVGNLPTDGFKTRTAGSQGSRNHGGGGTGYASGSTRDLVGLAAEETGWNGDAINNVQPSIIVEVWVRTA